MNQTEAVLAWAKCQVFDNRKEASRETAMAWAEAMPDVSLQEALDAITAHYAEGSDWLMPSHIVTRSRTARKARIAAAGPVDYPEGLTPVQEQDWRRCYHRLIGSGMPAAEALLQADRDYGISRLKAITPMPADARRVLGRVASGFEVA